MDEVILLGGKAVDEAGIGGLAPAIADAACNATWTRVRDLPIPSEKVIAAGRRSGSSRPTVGGDDVRAWIFPDGRRP